MARDCSSKSSRKRKNRAAREGRPQGSCKPVEASQCTMLMVSCVNGVEGGNRFRVGLKGPLRNDQIGEFGGNVDVRGLQRASLHGAKPARCLRCRWSLPRWLAWSDNRRCPASSGPGDWRRWPAQAAHVLLLAIAVGNADGSIGADGKALILAGRVAILDGCSRDRGSRVDLADIGRSRQNSAGSS